MQYSTLMITDGTTEVSLLRGEDGFFLKSWRPSLAQYKGGGVFQASPFVDGRRLAYRSFENAFETFELVASLTGDADQNDVVTALQELYRLLEKASDYWISDWTVEPVYLVAESSCEDSLRYATIKSWSSPDIDNPYAQPFKSSVAAAMDGIILNIERAHWQSEIPTTGTCPYISGYTYDGIGDLPLGLGPYSPAASLDDGYYTLPEYFLSTGSNILFVGNSASNTYNTYIRFPSVAVPQGSNIKEATLNVRAQRNDASVTVNLRIYAEATDDAQALTASDWEDARNRPKSARWVEWSPGAFVTGNFYEVDISLLIDEIVNRPNWKSGNAIGLIIVDDGSSANAIRAISSFDESTTPPRLYIFRGILRGQTETCTETARVYVANKYNQAQIDEVQLVTVGGGPQGNRITTTDPPYTLFDEGMVVGDYCLFGVHEGAGYPANKGPFNNLVLNLLDIGDLDTGDTLVWQYWNGAAWAALTVQDNTNTGGTGTMTPLCTSGIHSIHWEPPSDWATNTPVLDTGWFIRCYASVVSASPGPVTQIEWDPYTVVWPYVEIQASRILGDIPALLRAKLVNWSDDYGGSNPSSPVSWFMAAIRSYNRGPLFIPFLNCSSEQNTPIVTTVLNAGNASYTNEPRAPTGIRTDYSPGAPSAGYDELITFQFYGPNLKDYYGTYRAFLRVYQSGGSTGDYVCRLQIYRGDRADTSRASYFSEAAATTNTARDLLLDLGKISIPGASSLEIDESMEIEIAVECEALGSTGTLQVYDLVLMPVDEWAIESKHLGTGANPQIEWKEYAQIDSLIPRQTIRSIIGDYNLENIDFQHVFDVSASGPAILQANARQRLYFLTGYWNGSTGVLQTDFHQVNQVIVDSTNRYLALRGDR